MRKAAPLVTFKWIQFSGRTCSSRFHEAFKKAKPWQNESAQCTRKHSYQTTLMKSLAEALWCIQTMFLSKASTDNNCWQTERCSDDRSLSLYTSKVIQYYKHNSLGQRVLFAWLVPSAFLGRYASIIAVDLVQQKKLDFRNFCESTLFSTVLLE